MELQELTTQIVRTLDKHKAIDVQVLEVGGLTSVADRFVIASGGSTTQVKALADYVEEELKKQGVQPLREEGYNSAQWILLDYASVVVHVFLRDTRAFYDLERLWVDAASLPIAQFLDSEESQ